MWPWEVERCTLADFFATLEGWKRAHGVSEKFSYSDDEVAAIRKEAFG